MGAVPTWIVAPSRSILKPLRMAGTRHNLPVQDPNVAQPYPRVARCVKHGNHLRNAPSTPLTNRRVSQTVSAPMIGVTVSSGHAFRAAQPGRTA